MPIARAASSAPRGLIPPARDHLRSATLPRARTPAKKSETADEKVQGPNIWIRRPKRRRLELMRPAVAIGRRRPGRRLPTGRGRRVQGPSHRRTLRLRHQRRTAQRHRLFQFPVFVFEPLECLDAADGQFAELLPPAIKSALGYLRVPANIFYGLATLDVGQPSCDFILCEARTANGSTLRAQHSPSPRSKFHASSRSGAALRAEMALFQQHMDALVAIHRLRDAQIGGK